MVRRFSKIMRNLFPAQQQTHSVRYGESLAAYLYGQAAKSSNVFVIGGSIPESCEGKLYNTCTVFNPQGVLIAKHRKVEAS